MERSALPPIGDINRLARTREAWHALAEHVLAPARYRAEQRIGLRSSAGGFTTPTFGAAEQIQVDGQELVIARGDDQRRVPITTIGAAAAAVGIEPGAPSDVYPPTTALDVDTPLDIDSEAGRVLAAFFALGTDVLEAVRAEATDAAAPSTVQLWPEHFDLGLELGDEGRGERATFGASPGDAPHPAPYLYVLWWIEPDPDPYWNDTAFPGASLPYEQLVAAADARTAGLDFLRRGRELLMRRH